MLSKSVTTRTFFWNGTEISEAEYSRIADIIRNRPIAPDGYAYRLTESLTWEQYEVPHVDEVDEELTDAEALAIIMGGETA